MKFQQFAPGDIIEIETGSGLRHVQVTHLHQAYPEVLRGFSIDGYDVGDAAKIPSAFKAMFPLRGALERGSLKGQKIGTTQIPAADKNFPTFTTPIHDKNGEIAYWWFWDGDSLRYDCEPAENPMDIPRREVLTTGAFIEKLIQL